MKKWIIALLIISGAIGLYWFATPRIIHCGIASNDKSAIGSLKSIREMEDLFKRNDADENGINDYWTADVSGLYSLLNKNGKELQLIGCTLLQADRSPLEPITGYIGTRWNIGMAPKAGYLFSAMLIDEMGVPYNKNLMRDGKTRALNEKKFAFCAYPEIYGQTGTPSFIVNEEGTIWKGDTKGMPVLQWPGPDPSCRGWERLQ